MAKPTIVTRAGKGSALSFVEGDANFTNLQNATITVSDGTSSTAIDLNGTITFAAGSGISVDETTGTITISNTATPFDPASPGAIGGTTAAAGTFTSLAFKDPREAIYDLGTTGGTIAPNVSNGSVQKITLSSALTINAFTSPVAGQSVTLIIYGGTAYTAITSTMKFAGGVKTLTGTAGCIDILSIYYDGTTYFASLNKGFA
jgi:hypothetical protein